MAKKSKKQILKKLSKKLPNGSFYTLDTQKPIESVSTGISVLDYSLGTGGFPKNWMTMVYGESSSGKSALVLQSIGNIMKKDPDAFAAVIDLEKSMTPEWASKFGVDPERLFIARPTTTEEMITMTMDVIKEGVFEVVMVDSLGAGLLQSEIDNDKSRMAGSAGAITRMVKAINSAFIEAERFIKVEEDSGNDVSDFIMPAVVLINQARVKMDAMVPTLTYPGGKALEHMCGIVIQMRTTKAAAEKIMGTVDGVDMRVGWKVICNVVKNKLAVPGKQFGYIFVFKDCPEHTFGIDNAQSLADLAFSLGIVRLEGQMIYFKNSLGEEEKIRGRNNFNKHVHNDEWLQNYLAEEISRKMSENAKDEDLEALEEFNKGK